MGATEELEYDESMISLLEAVWGEGFMSPGGADEVDRVLGNKDLSGSRVLDIGCGIGGAAVHIALTRQPSRITGIDIEENLVARAMDLAEKKQRIGYLQLSTELNLAPCLLSRRASISSSVKTPLFILPTSVALAKDVYQLLSPGGWFLASDWLCGYEGEPSPQMQAYIDAEGLDFGLACARGLSEGL